MFLVLKLLVFYIWCCDGMRLGVQVMSGCLVDVSVAGRVAIRKPQWTHNQPTGSDSLQQPRHYTTRADKTTESSDPEDGHKVGRNMLRYL